MKRLPWELASDLTEDKIKVVGNFLFNIRADVVDLHDEESGDTRLVLGTRAYERCRTKLASLAKSKAYPWLEILTEEGRFTFKIGNTPVRITRNKPENLADRKLILSAETKQLLFTDIDKNFGPADVIRWFFVVDTPYKVPAETIYLVGYTHKKEIISKWEIPLEERVPFALTALDENSPQPVELPPATITLKRLDQTATGNHES